MRYNETERSIDSNTTHVFYVDGSHRQGNNTLRRLMLDCFPTISINKPLRHTVDNFNQALLDDDIVVATLRHPRQSINSFCGYKKIDPLDKKQITTYLEFYNYLHQFLFLNKDKIYFIDFNDIISKPHRIVNYFKDKFLIKDNNVLKYQNLTQTPFFTFIDENGVDDHNKTSTLETEDKLSWMLESSYYKQSENLYKSLLLKKIQLEDK